MFANTSNFISSGHQHSELRYQLLQDDEESTATTSSSTSAKLLMTLDDPSLMQNGLRFPLVEKMPTISLSSPQQQQLPTTPQMNESSSASSFSVLDSFRDKTIFITGATGFIGKVLVEKLLRIGVVRRIYILLRAKKGKTTRERLDDLLNKSPVFKFFHLDLSRVQAIDGDITKPDLGLSELDRQTLIREVNIVFHSAATVQFKGKLKTFLEQNVLGTDRVLKLCSQMASLKAVVYVSTAYSNCNLHNIEEKVYLFDDYCRSSSVDEYIEHLIIKYGNQTPRPGYDELCGRLNCYTFSKALAEWLAIKKYSFLPLTICRPSIVTHSAIEPAKGWCDTKNGVSGAMILGGLGIARTMILDLKCLADIVPVDYVVNCMIVMAAHVVALPLEQRKLVAHITTGELNPITWGQLLDYSRVAVLSKPFMKQIRPLAKRPVATDTFWGRFEHQLTKIFSHYGFAILADGLILLCGYRPFLMHITKRMHLGFDTLQPFTTRQWHFVPENYLDIFRRLSSEEQQQFPSDVTRIDWSKYIEDATLGTRRYMLKDDDSTIDTAIKRRKFLEWAYGTIEALIYLAIFAIIWYHLFVVFG